ncbi:MAG: hypothetical protein JWN70_6086 [Planctomycetaceae bacterium]|nr:hypothetical protein [Planctomycetaceae bacterium]
MSKSIQDSVMLPPTDFRCELTTFTAVRLSLNELAAVRLQPELRFPAQVTPQFLKNSDSQTIASLAAVYEAVQSMSQPPATFREWGVVSASRYIGRSAFAATLHRYQKDGPWGVSVQITPHNLLHSVSSTISLSLQCQGPCLGAGGGLRSEVDALLLAANLLTDPARPGVWMTWSYWDPELQIDEQGKPTSQSSCIAMALALQPIHDGDPRSQIAIRTRVNPGTQPAEEGLSSSKSSLASVLLDISRLSPKAFDVVCQLNGGLELDFSWHSRDIETKHQQPLRPLQTSAGCAQ